MPRPRTQRLAQADLTGSLGDRDQHDVHDAHAAHPQRHHANKPQHSLQAIRECGHHLRPFDRIPFRRSFLVLGIEMVPARHHFAHCRQSLLVQICGSGLEDDFVWFFQILEVPHQVIGHERLLIVRPVVHGVLNLVAQRADYFKLDPRNADGLPDRWSPLKHPLGRAMPEDDNPPMLRKVVFREILAVVDVETAHFSIGHFHSSSGKGHDTGTDLIGKVPINLRAHGFHNGDFIPNRFDIGVFILDVFPGSLPTRLEAGLPRPQHDDLMPHGVESVRDGTAEALPEGQQQDDRSQAPNDAQHGQQRAQPIAHQRLPTLRD